MSVINTADIKRMDMKEFVEKGFLQEVNRLFFHPRGLALSVDEDFQGNPASFGPIWDYRDDPEGICFSEATLANPATVEKAKSVDAELNAHREARLQLFGGVVIQPIPGQSN